MASVFLPKNKYVFFNLKSTQLFKNIQMNLLTEKGSAKGELVRMEHQNFMYIECFSKGVLLVLKKKNAKAWEAGILGKKVYMKWLALKKEETLPHVTVVKIKK